MSPGVRRVVVVALVSVTAASAHAQSLAEVARREAERRGHMKGDGKVYTNSDLTSDFTTPASPSPPRAAAPPPVTKSSAAADEPLQVPVAAPGTEVERQAPSDKGEDYWRQRAATIRAAISGQRAQIDMLESRVQSLAQGKTAADQREGDLSADLLDRAKADLASLEEEKTRFEALAKSKNVPESWLR